MRLHSIYKEIEFVIYMLSTEVYIYTYIYICIYDHGSDRERNAIYVLCVYINIYVYDTVSAPELQRIFICNDILSVYIAICLYISVI